MTLYDVCSLVPYEDRCDLIIKTSDEKYFHIGFRAKSDTIKLLDKTINEYSVSTSVHFSRNNFNNLAFDILAEDRTKVHIDGAVGQYIS